MFRWHLRMIEDSETGVHDQAASLPMSLMYEAGSDGELVDVAVDKATEETRWCGMFAEWLGHRRWLLTTARGHIRTARPALRGEAQLGDVDGRGGPCNNPTITPTAGGGSAYNRIWL